MAKQLHKRFFTEEAEEVEKNIISELEIAKSLIEDKELPITHYNYSYIKGAQSTL